jgi:hypothetical protein
MPPGSVHRVTPTKAVEREVVALQTLGDRNRTVDRRAQHRQRRRAKKRERAAWAQKAMRLGDPHIGVAPNCRAVLGDSEIERSIGIRDRFGVAVDQPERDAVLGGEASSGRQLRLGVIDENPRSGNKLVHCGIQALDFHLSWRGANALLGYKGPGEEKPKK